MKFLITITCLSYMTLRSGATRKDSINNIDSPTQQEYFYSIPGSDKSKFGYELNDEAKPFHHTTTSEDGVRLGCYGSIVGGVKYSTQYVADTHGYRIVHTNEPITVYPKSGSERQASFSGEFNEEEQQSRNIRFFFPDGCKEAQVTQTTQVTQVQPPPPKEIIKKKDEAIKIPPSIRASSSAVQNNVCCDDDKPSLVFQVPLKNKSGLFGDCAKLTVPIKGMSIEKLRKLSESGNYDDLLKAIIKDMQ